MIEVEEETPQKELRERWIEWCRGAYEARGRRGGCRRLLSLPRRSTRSPTSRPTSTSRARVLRGGRRAQATSVSFARFTDTPASLARPRRSWVSTTARLGSGRRGRSCRSGRASARGRPRHRPRRRPRRHVRDDDARRPRRRGDPGRVDASTSSPMTRGSLARPSKELVARFPRISGRGYPDRDPGERPWNRFPLVQPDRAQQARCDGRHADRERPRRVPQARRHRRRAGDEPVARHARAARGRLGGLPGDQRPAGLRRRDVVRRDRAVARLARLRHADGGVRRPRAAPAPTATSTSTRTPGRSRPTRPARSRSRSPPQAGLYARRHTGRGQYVDISITENFLGLIGAAVLDYTTTGRIQPPLGNRDYTRCRAATPAPATTAGSSSRSATTTTGPAFSARPGWKPEERLATDESRVRAPRRARRAAGGVDERALARGGGRPAPRRGCSRRPGARRRGRVRRPAPRRARLLLGDHAGRRRARTSTRARPTGSGT